MVHYFYLPGSSVGIMTIYDIAIVLIVQLFTAIWFYSMGVNAGYRQGRRAVREYYDKREKVRL